MKNKKVDLLSSPYQLLSILFLVVSFSYSMVYCHFYVNYFVQVPTDFVDSLIWSLLKFGVWWFLVPCLLVFYSSMWLENKRYVAVTYILSIVIATVYSVGLDLLFFKVSAHLAASLVTFLPTHITTSTFVLLGWFIYIRSNLANDNVVNSREVLLDQAKKKCSEMLTVQTGTQEIEISVNDIESISASGNYMEVDDGRGIYIIRKTMKELEAQFDSHQFVRIHRSYLINRFAIRSVNSNQEVILQSGKKLPVSQRYRKELIFSSN